MSASSQITISVGQGDQVLMNLSTDVPAVAAAALRSVADTIDPPKSMPAPHHVMRPRSEER